MENVMVEMTKSDNRGSEEMSNMVCKLTDFGFANIIKQGESMNLKLGTPLYMAPELINGQNYDTKIDVWAVGVIVFLMLTGKYAFTGLTKKEVYDTITNPNCKPDYTLLNKYWENGTQVKSFIGHCLNKNPDARYSAAELL